MEFVEQVTTADGTPYVVRVTASRGRTAPGSILVNPNDPIVTEQRGEFYLITGVVPLERHTRCSHLCMPFGELLGLLLGPEHGARSCACTSFK
jgi:hypothetical protein